jgi:hypothetical protein
LCQASDLKRQLHQELLPVSPRGERRRLAPAQKQWHAKLDNHQCGDGYAEKEPGEHLKQANHD